MNDTTEKLNIRYLGFENAVNGGRRLAFSVTAPGRATSRVTVEIPSGAFDGANRISFQESAAVCYEKLRNLIHRDRSIENPLHFLLTEQDIQQFRPRSRRAAAGVGAKTSQA